MTKKGFLRYLIFKRNRDITVIARHVSVAEIGDEEGEVLQDSKGRRTWNIE